MSLRARLTAIASAAVALAVVAAALVGWALVRQGLLQEVDDRLLSRQTRLDRIADLPAVLPADGQTDRRFVMLVQDEPTGVQVVAPDGSVARQVTFGGAELALAEPGWRPPAPVTQTPRLDDVTLGGQSYRLLSVRLDDGGILRLFQPLAALDGTLSRIGWALVGTALGGIAVAAVGGWLVSRSALRPVDRLVAATESVRRTNDLTARIDVGDRADELGRLADSMNAMLAGLEAARGQQRELIENASHELRTPLAVLRNDFGLLLRAEHDGLEVPAKSRAELLRDLDDQVAALTELVAEVVDLARGQIESEAPTRAALLPLVERAVARTRRVNPAATVTVSGEPRDALVRQATLERAVSNLVRNALQASGPAGTVEVEVRTDRDSHAIEVRDRGHGLRDEEIPHLFERFFRGTAARERHGAGLGLAIVAQAAVALGGETSAANRPGGGAVFTLRWPVRGAG
ncbi:HAMP domain-containing sensor histidine kinase [Microbacterium sp. CPCC 204701]|uniref:HAMP domain-containing sensor histidine kinase n=1 Tax=Microbacterium sp. CPCC 204701 TaxID=2493084 RepID=UPI000FD9A7F4|nr:HAMP domain-containing sensor histidine kinase [Microbacterium sp. CPCC 204701]